MKETILQSIYGEKAPKTTPFKENDIHYKYNEFVYEDPAFQKSPDKKRVVSKSPVVGTDGKLELRIFNENSYNGPKTEDFIRRAESLHEAAVHLLKQQSDNRKIDTSEYERREIILNNSLTEVKKTILAAAAIEVDKIKDKKGDKYYKKQHAVVTKILQDFTQRNLTIIHNGPVENLKKELKIFFNAEAEVVADKGRANLIHIYETEGHARVSMSEPQGDHTNPSTMRNKDELSNFTKVSSGVLNKDDTVNIEFSAYRHSSYPPIAITGSSTNKKMQRRQFALQSVRQMLTVIAQEMIAKEPELLKNPPLKINLSSMMLLTPLLKDQSFMGGASEMRQLKDSLIALNICNHQTLDDLELKDANGKEIKIPVEPNLTQMNIPSNGVLKLQFQKLGGEYNDNINNKGFYEFNENFMEFIKTQSKKNPVLKDIANPFLTIFTSDEARILKLKVDAIKEDLVKAKRKLDLPARYKELEVILQSPNKDEAAYEKKLKQIQSMEKTLNGFYKDIIKQEKKLWHAAKKDIQSMKEEIIKALTTEPGPDKEKAKALQVVQLFLDASEIYYSKSHKIPEHGHQFQTRYVLANQFMGRTVEFFCKSGEDRTGRLNNHIEEFLAYSHKARIFPKFDSKNDSELLKRISHDVHNGSVSKKITDQNAPGAEGLQQGSNFGSNSHLALGEFDRKNAQLAKNVFAADLPTRMRSKTRALMSPRKISRTEKDQNIAALGKEINADKKEIDDMIKRNASLPPLVPSPAKEAARNVKPSAQSVPDAKPSARSLRDAQRPLNPANAEPVIPSPSYRQGRM
jgi:hypothetical protein